MENSEVALGCQLIFIKGICSYDSGSDSFESPVTNYCWNRSNHIVLRPSLRTARATSFDLRDISSVDMLHQGMKEVSRM
jgi:hypothetical protein